MPTTTTGIATEFIQFTRASNATVTDSDGKVKWAPHNLLTDSESFDSALWLKSGIASVSANNTAAPNGTTTADKFLEDTSVSAQHLCNKSISVGGDQTYSFSCFAKSAERTNIALQLATTGGTVTRFGANFDLSAGTVSKTDSVSSPVNTSSSITPVGTTGWYLCTIKMTTISTATALYCYVGNSDSNNPTFSSGSPVYTGVSGNGAFFWGASLYRSDLAMQPNTSAYPMYNPTTPKNLLGFSEDINSWTKSGSTVQTNVVTAPNGLQTADKLVETATSGAHAVFQTLSFTAAPYTLSGYFKAAERSWLFMRIGFGAYFNLSTGVLGTVESGVTASITSVGDGWYRCAITISVAAGTEYPTIFSSTGNGVATYTGDGTSGIYLWGAQLSHSASLDSYSPVYGAAVTSEAYYGPRRDFDGATLACKGLLVEEQRTNFLLYSAQFDNASGWFGPDVTVTANNATAPDGTMSADKLVYGISSAYILQDYSTTTAGAYTGSLYLRADSATTVILRVQQSGGAMQSVTCSVTTSWQRFSVTLTSVAPTFIRVSISANANTPTVYAWGAQLEQGPFDTSYIPVGATTAGATRLADVASVSTQAFPYSATEGTVVVNVTKNFIGGDAVSAALYSGGVNDTMELFFSSANSRLYVATGGALQVNLIDSGTVVAGATTKAGFAYAANNFALSTNGGTILPATTATVPPVTTLGIGSRGGNLPFRGWIRQITYLPRRISNAELQTRTT